MCVCEFNHVGCSHGESFPEVLLHSQLANIPTLPSLCFLRALLVDAGQIIFVSLPWNTRASWGMSIGEAAQTWAVSMPPLGVGGAGASTSFTKTPEAPITDPPLSLGWSKGHTSDLWGGGGGGVLGVAD